jgi:hypothetical protein
LGDSSWGRIGTITDTSRPRKHNARAPEVADLVTGVRCRYDFDDIAFADGSLLDSAFQIADISDSATGGAVSKTSKAAASSLGPHDYYSSTCKICVNCSFCTGYYGSCVRCTGQDRSNDKGKDCGCGGGKSGCRKCGQCDKCGGTGDTCPGTIVISGPAAASAAGKKAKAPKSAPGTGDKIPFTAADLKSSSNSGSLNNVADDSNVSTYWQSGGSCPHHVAITVPQTKQSKGKFFDFQIYTSDHGSYSPEDIDVLAGPDVPGLKVVKSMTLPKSSGWVTMVTAAEFKKVFKVPPKELKFVIKKNHSGGCDTRVNCLKLVLPKGAKSASADVLPITVGDRVVLADTFSGNAHV